MSWITMPGPTRPWVNANSPSPHPLRNSGIRGQHTEDQLNLKENVENQQ